MTTWNNPTSKANNTFQNYLKHGSETILNDIKDFTFNSVVFSDGTLLKDITFAELVEQVWTTENKSSSPTWINPNKS